MCALTRSEAQSLASSSQPKGVAEAMDPAGKGKKGEKGNKGGWTERTGQEKECVQEEEEVQQCGGRT